MTIPLAVENKLSHALITDRLQVDRLLEERLCGQTGVVGDAMRYAVLEGGQRLRPILAVRVAGLLGRVTEITLRAASAVELLHCASLLVDDLPCMDNDTVRRNRPAVHIQFGESTAILAAFSLIGLAARTVADQPQFQLHLLRMLDASSLVGGQALDLALHGQDRENQRLRVTDLKTVPLFQLAVEAGLLETGDRHRQRLLGFGRELGIAYQMMDDYLDGEIDDRSAVERQFSQARALLAPFGESAANLHSFLDHLNVKAD